MKKILLILVAGVVVGGGVYFYISNRQADGLIDNTATLKQEGSITSKDGKFSAYIKNTGDTDAVQNKVELHIINNHTKEDSLVTDLIWEDPEACRLDGFSPHNAYIVKDCGTDTLSDYTFININAKKVFSNRASGYFWLQDEGDNTILQLSAFNVPGWNIVCTSGADYGITKTNLASGQTVTLKKPDSLHEYFIHKVLADGSILYEVLNLPEKPPVVNSAGEYDQNKYDTYCLLDTSTHTTYWIMDSQGNIIKQVDNIKDYK